MGRNGRQWVLANAGWDALAARYLEVMKRLTDPIGKSADTVPAPTGTP
jgi:hypothetical protein